MRVALSCCLIDVRGDSGYGFFGKFCRGSFPARYNYVLNDHFDVNLLKLPNKDWTANKSGEKGMEISKQMCALFGGIVGMVISALLFKILPTDGRGDDDSARSRRFTKLPCTRTR